MLYRKTPVLSSLKKKKNGNWNSGDNVYETGHKKKSQIEDIPPI
jgi:hypothetical protein